MRDCYKPLDEKIIFSNDVVKQSDYASKRLPYPLEEGSTKNWDRLMGVLYSPDELHKLEWAIGSIVTGDSKRLEKFFVLYGSGGTGKGTFLKIVQMLFGDYCAVFNAKNLGDPNNQFALEPFSNNPLVAIDPDGKLDRIEDNTRLNTIVSHERMTVNEKFKKQYSTEFKAMLFVGSNSPVRITDAKSGLIRRLVDVSPTGNTLKRKDYDRLWKNIPFELGAIAYKCKQLYLEDPEFYDDYRPVNMMGTTNDFYNYILENSFVFEEQNYTEEFLAVGCQDDCARINCRDTERLPKRLIRGDLFLRRSSLREMLNVKSDHGRPYRCVIFFGTEDRGFKRFAGGTPVWPGEQDENGLVLFRRLGASVFQPDMPTCSRVRPGQNPAGIVGLRLGIRGAEPGGNERQSRATQDRIQQKPRKNSSHDELRKGQFGMEREQGPFWQPPLHPRTSMKFARDLPKRKRWRSFSVWALMPSMNFSWSSSMGSDSSATATIAPVAAHVREKSRSEPSGSCGM